MTSDDERRALLAGRPLEALEPDELEQVARWTQLLADPETWEEPAPDLEDLVIASVAAAPAPTRTWVSSSGRAASGSWLRPLIGGLAAAAAIVAAVIILSRDSDDRPASFASAALSGTELAPEATGTVQIFEDSAGFRVELRADDLPPLDGGRFYQAWLKGDSGSIPIGTFSEGDGTWVTLWSGASPADFPTLTVTIEAPDGDQASSGELVLSGDTSA
jgi:hypothetical protein